MKTDQKLTYLITRAGLMQDYAIECYDMAMFFKYNRIALYLIGRRIANFKNAVING